ncbi:MAG: hypothetical protein V4543_02360 [Bacteroidota bacterium]
MENKSAFDQTTPASSQRVRFFNMLNNPALETEDIISLREALMTLKTVQKAAMSINYKIDPDKPETEAGIMRTKLDPLVAKFFAPFSHEPEAYKNSLIVQNQGLRTTANTYVGAMPDFMELFVSDPKNELGFSPTDIRLIKLWTDAVNSGLPVDALGDLLDKAGRPPKLKEFYEHPRALAYDAQLQKDLEGISGGKI